MVFNRALYFCMGDSDISFSASLRLGRGVVMPASSCARSGGLCRLGGELFADFRDCGFDIRYDFVLLIRYEKSCCRACVFTVHPPWYVLKLVYERETHFYGACGTCRNRWYDLL